jgi:hypothetical protein
MIEGISYYKRPKKNNKKLVITIFIVVCGVGFGVYYVINNATITQHNEIIITPQPHITQNTSNADTLGLTTNRLPNPDSKHLNTSNINTMPLEPLDKTMEYYK